MPNFVFDYSQFIAYYTNPQNLLQDVSQRPNLHYFKDLITIPNQLPISKICPTDYITVGGIRVYISTGPNNRIYFTIPTMQNQMFWDDHYHFGIRKGFVDYTSKPKRTYDVVFFHKTLQDPFNNGKYPPTNCYFEDQLPISQVENIICMQGSATNTMISKFPQEIDIVREIICRPFLGVRYLGGGLKGNIVYLDEKQRAFTIKGTKRTYLTYH
jgi:hypothetical protein